MKRTQKLGSLARGKKCHSQMKKEQRRAERQEARQRLKKDPETMERTLRRRYWGHDD